MHVCAEGRPELVEAPAPRNSASGAARRTPMERTKASRERTVLSLAGDEAAPSDACRQSTRSLVSGWICAVLMFYEHFRAWPGRSRCLNMACPQANGGGPSAK